ncbi:hypothetical protein GGD63_007995 [Bradyrhizobium sp. cir1]|nr:hypothetical protein [Bradyrhizobium sp. cir1]
MGPQCSEGKIHLYFDLSGRVEAIAGDHGMGHETCTWRRRKSRSFSAPPGALQLGSEMEREQVIHIERGRPVIRSREVPMRIVETAE